jgi:hypothetical protein
MLRSLLAAVLLGVLLPVTVAAGVAPSASASASVKPVCFVSGYLKLSLQRWCEVICR